MRLAPGAAFDRYTIEAFLGEGGMGQVYRAHDGKLHRRVALKLLLIEDRTPDTGRSTGKARLLREARAAAGLDHPNAIAVFDVGEVDGTPYIAMELVDGRSLRALIEERATPLTTRLRWLTDVASALAAAHRQGIVHRDVKPENIMVRGDGVVKVLDFGIARRAAPPPQPHEPTAVAGSVLGTLTATGAVVGTPLYMAPEQMRGEDIDGRADQFAWGVVAYEVLFGRPPWQGAEALVVVAQILMDDPRDLRAIAPEVPTPVAAAVMRALSKRPEDRFASLDELLASLARPATREPPPSLSSTEVASAPPVSVTAPGAPSPTLTARSSARSWRGPAVAALALAALAAGWLGHRATSRRATTAPRSTAAALLPPLRFRQVVLATDEPGPDVYPNLAPDGTWFVYARRVGGSWDVFRRRVGGGNPQNLTADRPDVDDTQPSISPDAERIAFRSERDGGGIFVMGATGESLRRLSDFGYDPSWTADATEIIVGSWPSSFKYPAAQSLWAIDVATGARRRIYPLDPAAAIDSNGTATPSPHNRRVAWWGDGLWTAARDGSAVLRLTDGQDVGPVWAPDGRSIWFLSLRAGSPALWRIAIDETSGRALGPPELALAGLGAVLKLGGFSSDGRRFIFSATTGRSTIEKVELDAAGDAITGPPITVGFGRDPVVRGEHVVFHANGRVQVMNRDGGGRRQLTAASDGVDTHPGWSADGGAVLFTSTRGGALAAWAVDVDGGKLRRATDVAGASHDAIAAPDGQRLAVGVPGGALIVASGTGATVLERIPAPDGPGTGFKPRAWSRDGALVAGDIDHVDGAARGVAVWSTATHAMTIASRDGSGAAWLRDGRLLTLDGPSLVVHDLTTGRARPLYTVPHGGLGETVSVADDGWIFYTREAYDADIWMVELEPAPAAGP